jgi:hypothetical protein
MPILLERGVNHMIRKVRIRMFVAWAALGIYMGSSGLAHTGEVVTRNYAVNMNQCIDELERTNSLTFECRVQVPNTKGQNLVPIYSDKVRKSYSDCKVEVESNPFGYTVQVSKDWYLKRAYLNEIEARACLEKAGPSIESLRLKSAAVLAD